MCSNYLCDDILPEVTKYLDIDDKLRLGIAPKKLSTTYFVIKPIIIHEVHTENYASYYCYYVLFGNPITAYLTIIDIDKNNGVVCSYTISKTLDLSTFDTIQNKFFYNNIITSPNK